MTGVTIVGCGFVADLYLRSFAVHPDIPVLGVYDLDAARAAAFAAHWDVPRLDSLEALIAATPQEGLILNLTNPHAHAEVTRACLSAGRHVFCEKPMTLQLDAAADLLDLAATKNVQLASAPSSVLGETAQILARAVRQGTAGTARLAYAELDDGFIPQAPLEDWIGASGAPWPYEDEFRVGCTLEHAGYYLSWLIAMFGPVRTVNAAATELVPGKRGVHDGAPDFSVATLFFHSGMTARLTCSIAAPHDHRMRIIGDAGVLEVKKAWDNAAPVRYRRRMVLRRRLLELPVGRRLRITGPTHPKVKRLGAAAMNFALGPAEMLAAIGSGGRTRLGGDYALHLTEVTLAIQSAGEDGCAQRMQTSCALMEPMSWAR